MVNIDTVYQRVLALANKEQRGYITPQEFNLFANQAQMEIFEQYFYDLNQVARIPGNDYFYADVDDLLEEKMQIFDSWDDQIIVSGWDISNAVDRVIPNYVYRIHRVEFNNVSCEILKTKDFEDVILTPLTMPTDQRPVANLRNNIMRVRGNGGTPIQATSVFYFRIPNRVQWGYVVVNNQAMFDTNPAKTMHFELHRSEETELVYKILKYAGISMKRDDVVQTAQGLESLQVQQEKQ